MTASMFRVNLKNVHRRSGQSIFWMVEIDGCTTPGDVARKLRGGILPVTVLWTRRTETRGTFRIVERRQEALTQDMVLSIEYPLKHLTYLEN